NRFNGFPDGSREGQLMTYRIDPEKNEIKALKQVTNWRNKRVLEIGCGNGRLTRRLARLGAHVHAINQNADLIKLGRKELPNAYTSRIRFNVGKSTKLSHPNEVFDVVL